MATYEKRVKNEAGRWVTIPKSEWRKRHPGAEWRVKIRRKGVRSMTRSFATKTEATEWAEATETDIKRGRNFDLTEADRQTLGALVERYKRDVLPRKKDGGKQGKQLDWWASKLGAETLLKDLSRARIVEARDALQCEPTRNGKTKSGSTVNRYLAALSHACTVATKEWEWLEDNPCRNVGRLKEGKARTRFLSDDERERLFEACKVSELEALYPIVLLAIATGARKSKLLGVKWSDVDLAAGRITWRDTKNGEDRTAPLGAAVTKLLADRKAARTVVALAGEDLVFDVRVSQLDHHWRKAREAAGLAGTDLRFHDLRRTCGTYLGIAGFSEYQIMAVTGHKSPAMVKRYVQVAGEHVRECADALDDRMFGGEG